MSATSTGIPSPFPLIFRKPSGPGPDPELEPSYRLLETFCNSRHPDNENQLRILRNDAPNSFRGGLTAEEAALKFLAVSASWEGCISLGRESSFCLDHAHHKKQPCYCRHLFDGHHMAPVYLLQIPDFGLGVFAHETILKGQYILDQQGELCRTDDNDDAEGGRYSMEIAPEGKSTELELDASRIGGLGRFLNHSCDPNVKTFPVIIDGTIRVVMLASKDIQPSQQLCWDYGAVYFRNRGLLCYCGSPKCKIKPTKKVDKGHRYNYLKFTREHAEQGLSPTLITLDTGSAHREACRLALDEEKALMSSATLTIAIPDPDIPREILMARSPDIAAAIFSISHSIQQMQLTIPLMPGINVKKEVKKFQGLKVGVGGLTVKVEEPPKKGYGVCSGMEHSGLPTIDPKTLYVGNLPAAVGTEELTELFQGTNFSRVGKLPSKPGEELGAGYIKFKTAQDALVAFTQKFHKTVAGKPITLRFMRLEKDEAGNWTHKS